MTNETLEKHEKTCDICQTTNPENKIGKRLATKAIQRNSENNDNGPPKGELYDTQGIEGLRRVGDSKKQIIKEHETSIIDVGEEKKLTGREWIIQHFIDWNYGESNLSFGTQELHHAIDLTETDERKKVLSELTIEIEKWVKDPKTIEKNKELAMPWLKLACEIGEEKGRREVLEDLLQHGSWLRVKELAKKYGVKP